MMGQRVGMRPAGALIEQPLWSVLRTAGRPLTIEQCAELIRAPSTSVRQRLERWQRAGLVRADGLYRRQFIMTQDVGGTPPKVDRAGCTTIREPNGRQRLWTAMRVLKRFDYPTLQITAGVERGAAATYVNALVHAGFIRTQGGKRYREAFATFTLIRRSGPKAPIVHQARVDGQVVRTVSDPNDGSRHGPAADGAREVNHVR